MPILKELAPFAVNWQTYEDFGDNHFPYIYVVIYDVGKYVFMTLVTIYYRLYVLERAAYSIETNTPILP